MLKIETKKIRSGPIVTVGMPVYNGEQHLAKAIESILEQDFQDFEFLISDNGSDDATPDICIHYERTDDRIKYYRYPKNSGSYRNFRRLVEASSGKYFMWASADDLREKTMITDCLPVLEEDPSVVICYPQAKSIDENGRFLGFAKDYVKADQKNPKERFSSIIWKLCICNVLYGLIRADALHQVRWPANSSQGIDHIILSELALLGRFIQIPKPLFIRRFYPGTRKFHTIEEHNSHCLATTDPGNKSEGITLPYCEFALETLNIVKFASLNENDRAELIIEILKCFRTRWGKQVSYDVQRAIQLIHRGDFRKSWGKSPPVKGHRITEEFYISMILTRLEVASFILPGFPGLQNARAICLQRLGHLNEARAIASAEAKREQNSQSNTKRRVRKSPMAYIEISGVCNGKCLYCAQRRLRQEKHFGNTMSSALFKQILERLLERDILDIGKNRNISLYNWGEPFMNPEINDILQILKRKELRARISSNFIRAPNINKDCLPVIGSLALSLSGFSQETYGKIHGASLNKTLDNFERLYEEIRKHSPQTYIYIAWHRYLFNESEFWDAHKYFDRPGINFIPSVAHFNDLYVTMDFLRGKLPENRKDEAGKDLFLDYILEGLDRIKKESNEDYHCPEWDRLVIDETGQLLLCCGVTRYDSEHVLGNILEMSEQEIWRSKSRMPFCSECISSGVARWCHDSSFQMMPPPANSELSLTDVRN